MTYAESVGQHPWDWNAFLATEEHTEEEWEEAEELASEWPDCACGTLDRLIPRLPNGTPGDTMLFQLGIRFHYAIAQKDIREAKPLLALIKSRAAEVLAEMKL